MGLKILCNQFILYKNFLNIIFFQGGQDLFQIPVGNETLPINQF